MRSLAETIDQTLSNIGREPCDLLFETIVAFDNLGLSDEEEICAIASALASNAAGPHRRHVARYIEAIKVWAVEMAVDAASPPPRLYSLPTPESVAEGTDLLVGATRELIEVLEQTQATLQDRLVAELTLYTRLLKRHDVNTINLALHQVTEAAALAGFKPGIMVAVPLRETRALTRTDRLEDLMVRGTA
ncbi:MAG: hypothetical protein QOJ54_2770 [Aliidongia sp.]|jgi:hypothetical protein|nr:hypothetical protein [Aliidongia sp.]